MLPALVQGPLSRFGDTAANTGMMTLMDSYDSTKNLPVGLKTVSASAAAAAFRIFLMPIDTVKTTMQVTGKFSNVIDKIKIGGPLTLYNGEYLETVWLPFVLYMLLDIEQIDEWSLGHVHQRACLNGLAWH